MVEREQKRFLPKDAKIFLYSDFTRGKSKARNDAAGIHGVSTTMFALSSMLTRRGYDTQLITGQDLKHLIPLAGRPHILYPINPSSQLQRMEKEKPTLIGAVVEGHLGIRALRRARKLGIPSLALYTTNVSDYVRINAKGIAKPFARYITAPFLEKLFAYGMRQADAVIVPTEEIKEKIAPTGVPKERIHVLTRGIDHTLFHRPKEGESNPYEKFQWFTKNHPKIILYTGRISPEKNYQELLSLLPQFGKEKHLVFIGPPGTVKDTKVLNDIQQKYPHFHWLGAKEHQQMGPYYQYADLFVTPSMSETFGHTPNESWLSGTPVVVANDGIMSQRVDSGITGYIYTSGNKEELQKAIDKGLQLKESIPHDVFDQHVATHLITWDACIDAFLKIAESAIEKNTLRQRRTKRKGE